jgi:cytochrome c5
MLACRLLLAMLTASLLLQVQGCERVDAADPTDGFKVLSVGGVPGASGESEWAEASPELWETPLSDPLLEAGRVVWKGTCIRCHGTGLGEAPLIGRRDLWAPRLEQGLDVLVDHALGGFYGDVGEMPARGGNADLSDEDVRAAVHFMASRAM